MSKKNGRATIAFACCVLAMPTCTKLLPGFSSETPAAALAAGILLGAAHLLVRPIVRLLTAPIGCLTLGLILPLIDIGLIYICDHFVNGFSVKDPLQVLLAVVLINTITFIATGRK